MSMDCSRRRKSSFSGDEELRKMSRVWMQEPQVMSQQQPPLVVSVTAAEQHIIQRLHQQQQQQQQQQHELSNAPLSMQQRAMAAIALQEIRSSMDPNMKQQNQQQQHQQQQQQQVVQAAQAAQVQAQLLHQKYQHLVHQQLKPGPSPLQNTSIQNLQMVDTRYQVPVNVHHQLPVAHQLVVQSAPLTPPPVAPPPVLDTAQPPDPSKHLPASPQLMNIPPVIFPPSLTSSPTPTSRLLQQNSHQLCPNMTGSDLQQAKSAWFSSSSSLELTRGVSSGGGGGTTTTTGSNSTIYCQDRSQGLLGLDELHQQQQKQQKQQQQQQQHQQQQQQTSQQQHHQQQQQHQQHQQHQQQQQQQQQISCEHVLDSSLQGYNCSSSLKASSSMIMPPPGGPGPTVYNQTSNNNNAAAGLRPSNPVPLGADQLIPDMKNVLPENHAEKSPLGHQMPSASTQQQHQQRPPPTRTFTKVYKLGSIGRAVDVARFKNYVELRAELSRMFGLDGQLDQRNGWQLVFVDKENDLLLVGDDPWEEFVSSVRGIRILSPSEVSYYTSDERGGEAVV